MSAAAVLAACMQDDNTMTYIAHVPCVTCKQEQTVQIRRQPFLAALACTSSFLDISLLVYLAPLDSSYSPLLVPDKRRKFLIQNALYDHLRNNPLCSKLRMPGVRVKEYCKRSGRVCRHSHVKLRYSVNVKLSLVPSPMPLLIGVMSAADFPVQEMQSLRTILAC